MSEQFGIEEHAAVYALEVAAEVSMMKIPQALAQGYGQINDYLKTLDLQPSGCPYARYLDLDWEKVRKQGTLSMIFQLLFSKQKMCAGMPVAEPMDGQGNIQFIEIPAGRYVTATHRGPYQKVGDTYKALTAWAEEQGLRLVDHSRESYVNDPTTVASADIETHVSIQIVE